MVRGFESSGFEYNISHALQVEPSERYPNALALVEDLRGYLHDAWPRYRARELAAERALLLRAARRLKEPVAYSVTESGILPAPVDQPWDGA